MMVRSEWYLDPLSPHKKRRQDWTPLKKLSGSVHDIVLSSTA